jgi:nucleoid-associated protein YgaU
VVSLVSLVPVWSQADGMPPTDSKAAPPPPPPGGNRLTMGDLAPDAPSTYTVVKGDTLWGIAGKFLKDPWRWPQIWQKNRDQIKDPHWIYPGDVIRLDTTGGEPRLVMGSGGTAADAEANVVKVDPRVRVESLRVAIPSIPGTAIGPFLTQPLIMEREGIDLVPSIVATEENRVVVGAGTNVYADRLVPSDGINWQIFRPAQPVKDPETGEILGYEAKYVGDARVRRYGETTTLEVTKARMEVNRGDRLTPAREAVVPNYMPHAPDKMIRGTIMAVDGGVLELGQWAIVTINRGARDGLQVGHVLASYRRGVVVDRVQGDAWEMPRWLARLNMKPNPVVPEPPQTYVVDGKTLVRSTGPIRLPDERNGLVFIFRVFDKLSYGMVMKASRPIFVGDLVQTP